MCIYFSEATKCGLINKAKSLTDFDYRIFVIDNFDFKGQEISEATKTEQKKIGLKAKIILRYMYIQFCSINFKLFEITTHCFRLKSASLTLHCRTCIPWVCMDAKNLAKLLSVKKTIFQEQTNKLFRTTTQRLERLRANLAVNKKTRVSNSTNSLPPNS